MANAYINAYKNNPTAGGMDGTTVSTGGVFTAPIRFTLDASQNESQTVKLAIRAEAGYTTSGTTTIRTLNDTNNRLKLCWTENGTFTNSISTAESISSVNTIFYAQASAVETENPQTDRSASFVVNAVIASV